MNITSICGRLETIEREYNIKVLFAVESGSRTWGFASEDSDWDVRFVYVRPLEWYLQPSSKNPDTISWMSPDKIFDFVGWDLSKVLTLINLSNPSISEWLYSNDVYINRDGARDVLRCLLHRAQYMPAYLYHYRSMAKRNWKAHFEGKKEGKLKKYFYIIYPILIRIKRAGSSESDIIAVRPELNSWICEWLAKDVPFLPRAIVNHRDLVQHLHSFSRTYFPEVNPLVEACKYSFKDLLAAARRDHDPNIVSELYAMTQQRRNNEVKILCIEAGWYWHDVVSDGQIYTAFSPKRKMI